MQCDIRKYFPSIDLEILRSILHKKIRCPSILWLIDKIIDNSNEQAPSIEYFPGDTLLTPLTRKRGLPIGNLTSQFFANVYLNSFDHYVKEHLHCSKYLRYVDDLALFSDDWQYLQHCRISIENYLVTLRLKSHPIKSQQFEIQQGANFVGFRVLCDLIRIRNDNLRRGRQRSKNLQQAYGTYQCDPQELIQRLQSWETHLKHSDTYHLIWRIFDDTWFKRHPDIAYPAILNSVH